MKLSSRVARAAMSAFVSGSSTMNLAFCLPPAVERRLQFGLPGGDARVGGDQRLEVRSWSRRHEKS